jgi:hypothetical protein
MLGFELGPERLLNFFNGGAIRVNFLARGQPISGKSFHGFISL